MLGLLQNETAAPAEAGSLGPIVSLAAVAMLIVVFVLVARRT